MFFLKLYLIIGNYIALWILPIWIIWCLIPNKSLIEGFLDWFNED